MLAGTELPATVSPLTVRGTGRLHSRDNCHGHLISWARQMRLAGMFVAILTGMHLPICAAAPPQSAAPGSGVQIPEAAIQEVAPDEDWPFRFDLFQMLLEQNELRPIKDFRTAFDQPRKSVIVLIGNNSLLRLSQQLRAYLGEGGALLIAGDRGGYLQGMFQMEPGPVLANAASVAYQDFADCLRIKDIDPDHELGAGVAELIFNRTGSISHLARPAAWDIVARLPEQVGGNRFQRATQPERPVVAVLKASTAQQTFIVSADHSLFTNGMLWHGDNAVFAINVATMLSGQQRSQLLFVVDQRPQDSYLLGPISQQLNLPEVEAAPELTPAQMVDVANSVIGSLEDENVLNELLLNRPRPNVRPHIYRRSILFLMVALLAVAIFVRLMGKTNKSSKRQPQIVSVASRAQARRGTRARAPLQSPEGRVAAAVLLCQDFCQEATRAKEPQLWIQRLEEKLQRLPADAANADLRTKLARVLAWATHGSPKPISEVQLLGLSRDLFELREVLV